ncbi:MAG: molybdenum cofactor guanylyltransferase [Chlorobi bacterium]|nr:molybdenum cofactor guanylyltransferase [Chlorobiota bacterium]
MNNSGKIYGGILCGGKSRRMNGFPKGNLVIAGIPMIERVRQAMKKWVQEIVLAGASEAYSHYGLPMIKDVVPGLGPAGGILSLLKHYNSSQAVLVCPCDVPLISSESLGKLIKFWQSGNYDIVVATDGHRTVPVVGIYSPLIVNKWEKLVLKDNKNKLHELIEHFQCRTVALPQKELFNVNSEADAQRLIELLKTEPNA